MVKIVSVTFEPRNREACGPDMTEFSADVPARIYVARSSQQTKALRVEEERLAEGWTYELPTFYEVNAKKVSQAS